MRKTLTFLSALFLCALRLSAQQQTGTVVLQVRSESGPATQVEVQAAGPTATTDNRGEATLQIPPGEVEIHFRRVGFAPKDIRAMVISGQTIRVNVELDAESVI